MSETRDQILEEIKIQGDLVRKLKAAKEPKEKVCFSSRSVQIKDNFQIKLHAFLLKKIIHLWVGLGEMGSCSGK